MKLLKSNVKFIVIFILLLGQIVSCTKEGPVGPIGPQGPAGPQGVQGNANVQTVIFPTSSTNWVTNNVNWMVNLSIPAITQDLIDKGSISVFWEQTTNSTQMPFTIGVTDYMYYIAVNQISIQVSQTGSYLFSNPAFYTPVNFKVVLIPGP